MSLSRTDIVLLIMCSLFFLAVIVLAITAGIQNNNQNMENFTNKKICVIITGFAPRSLKYTHKSITTEIIEPLQKSFRVVDIFHYSLTSKSGKIESNRDGENGLSIDNNSIYLLKTNKTISEYQEDINLPTIQCLQKENHKVNPLRQFYYEKKAVNSFPIGKYDACVMITSDSYFLTPINIKHVHNICNTSRPKIYTTSFNQSSGIANGFYIAKPNILKKLCSRGDLYTERCKKLKLDKQTENPEIFLKWVFRYYKFVNTFTPMFYIKIRATKKSNGYFKYMSDYKIKKNKLDTMLSLGITYPQESKEKKSSL